MLLQVPSLPGQRSNPAQPNLPKTLGIGKFCWMVAGCRALRSGLETRNGGDPISDLKERGYECQAPPSNALWVFTLSGQRKRGALRRPEGMNEQSWESTKHIQVTANSLTGQETRGWGRLGCRGGPGADGQQSSCQQEHQLLWISSVQYY